MALTELTKVTGPGIHTLSNILSHNIKSSGIITATKFSGPLDSIGGNFAGVITATNGVFSGNVTIGGTLTYEDVTNIDSVGIITARGGIDCNGDIDVDGHTELDNGNVSGVVTFTNSPNAIQMNDGARVSFGTSLKTSISYDSSASRTKIRNYNDTLEIGYRNTEIHHSNVARLTFDSGNTFSNAVNTSFTGANYHAVWIPSSNLFRLNDNAKLAFGSQTDTTIHHNNSNLLISNTNGNIDVTGNVVLNNDISVDGHTNLDNVSIAGVTTSGNITISSTAPVLYLTDTNADSDFSLVVNGGSFRLRDETNGVNRFTLSSSGTGHFMGTCILGESTFGSSSRTKVYSGQGTICKNALMVLNPSASVAGRGAGVAVGAIGNGDDYIGTLYGSRDSNGDNRGTTTLEGKDAIVIKTNASGTTKTAATFDTSGRVLISNTLGLGGATSNPSELLHAQTVSGEGKIVVMGATTGTVAISGLNGASRVLFGDSSTENAGNITYTHSSDTLSFRINGNTRWKFDSSGHFLPDSVGSYNIGSTGAEIGNVYLADSKNVFFGSDQDAEIYHNGSSLYMNNSTGNFYIRSGGGQILMRPSSSYDAIVAKTNEVELYYNQQNHSTPKLKTSATGITVDGEVATSQDYPNIQPTLDLNFAAVKKLDPRITFYRTIIGSYIDEHGNYRWASINEPRFDHDEVTHESKGLLMEVARTNKLSSGNNIPSGGNSGGNPGPSLVANNVEAPDGSFTARTIDYSNASSNMNSANIEFSWDNTPAGKTYSASIWVKGTQGHTINMYLDASGQGSGNLNESKIHRTLTGKWQRMSVYYTYPSGANAAFLRIGTRSLHSLTQGTATVVSFWGTTVVEESRPGSTIATPIVATTTAADYALIDGEEFSEFYSPLEHTTVMIGKRAANVAASDGRLYTISNGTSSQVAPDWDFNDGTHLRLSTNVGGSSQMVQSITSWSGINDEFKIAAGMAVNNQIGVVNGTAIAAADTSCLMPTGVDRLYFGLRGDGGNQGSLTIKRFIFYPKRLPDSQLVTLTS